MGPVTVLSSDAHVFEPPDLWTKRIAAAFRDRAPRMVRVDGADEIVVGLCRKVGFWRQNPKIGSWKINHLRVSTFLFSVICDRVFQGAHRAIADKQQAGFVQPYPDTLHAWNV